MTYNEKMRIYMAKRYRYRIEEAKKILGSKCSKCDATENLQFDHKQRRQGRDFVIAKKIAGIAESKLHDELKKCQLLCEECHNKKTQAELGRKVAKGTHGTLSSYRHCGPPKCDSCKTARRKYLKQWKKGCIPRRRGTGLLNRQAEFKSPATHDER